MNAGGLRRRCRGKTEPLIKVLDLDPVHLQPHQLPGDTLFILPEQRGPSDKVFLLQMNHPAETKLKRRVLLLSDERLFAAVVIYLNQKQASFNAGYVERQHACGMNVEAATGIHKSVPYFDRVACTVATPAAQGNPDLIPEIAGVAS